MYEYRKVFVGQPGHDMRKLRNFSDQIVFFTSGVEKIEDCANLIETTLSKENFDPEFDALVLVGRSNVSFLIGKIIGEKYPEEKLNIGIFAEGEYTFIQV